MESRISSALSSVSRYGLPASCMVVAASTSFLFVPSEKVTALGALLMVFAWLFALAAYLFGPLQLPAMVLVAVGLNVAIFWCVARLLVPAIARVDERGALVALASWLAVYLALLLVLFPMDPLWREPPIYAIPSLPRGLCTTQYTAPLVASV